MIQLKVLDPKINNDVIKYTAQKIKQQKLQEIYEHCRFLPRLNAVLLELTRIENALWWHKVSQLAPVVLYKAADKGIYRQASDKEICLSLNDLPRVAHKAMKPIRIRR